MDFEIKIIKFLQSGRSQFFDVSFQMISAIGSVIGVVALVLFFLKFKAKMSFWFLITYGFVFLTINTIKLLVSRARPFAVCDDIQNIGDSVTDFSFPSGHAACATAIAIFIAYFLFSKFKTTSMRVCVGLSCALYVGIVCLSRMYLGKHFLTDVLAGVAISAVICIAGIMFMRYCAKKKETKNEIKNGN